MQSALFRLVLAILAVLPVVTSLTIRNASSASSATDVVERIKPPIPTSDLQDSKATKSPIADLAASLAPSDWAEVKGVDFSAITGGKSAFNALPFSISSVWDVSKQKIHFAGADHGGPSFSYYSYDAASNKWEEHGAIPATPSHGYDHLTMNPNSGILYLREYGIWPAGNRIFQYVDGAWSFKTKWPVTAYVTVDECVDWWTGRLDGAGDEGALIVYNCGGANLLAWDPLTDKWFADIKDFGAISRRGCVIEYSSIHNVAVFAARFDNREVYRLNADQTVTRLADAPFDQLGVQAANFVVDPVTGFYLVLGYGQFWELDPRGKGSWRQLPNPPSAVGNPGIPNRDSVISASIKDHGVVEYTTCRRSKCNMHIYRHADKAGSVISPSPASTSAASPSPTSEPAVETETID